MAQSKAEVEILSSEEYEEQLSNLTVQVARKVVKRCNNDNFSGDYGEFYQLIEGAFYEDAPLSVIQFCEYPLSASLAEIAANFDRENQFAQVLAHDLLTVAVRDRVLSMMDGVVIDDVEIERKDGGTWKINEDRKSGILLPDGWTELDEDHPDDGVVAFSHSYFRHESGYELVIWEEVEESQSYMSKQEDEKLPYCAVELYDQVGEFVEGSGFESLRWAKSTAKLCMQTLSEP